MAVAYSYWRASRTPSYGMIVGVGLLILYEGGALALGTSLRNGAEVWLVSLLSWVPGLSEWELKALALGALALLVGMRRERPPLRPRFLAGLGLEATVYSLLLSTVVLRVLSALSLAFPAGTDLGTRLTLSLGAGVYEELLFRVLLFGGLAWLLKGMVPPSVVRFAVAALVSSLLFAAAHHVGALGEPFRLGPFAYRTVSGLAFTALYLVRGFGVTALSHALYNVWVALGVV